MEQTYREQLAAMTVVYFVNVVLIFLIQGL